MEVADLAVVFCDQFGDRFLFRTEHRLHVLVQREVGLANHLDQFGCLGAGVDKVGFFRGERLHADLDAAVGEGGQGGFENLGGVCHRLFRRHAVFEIPLKRRAEHHQRSAKVRAGVSELDEVIARRLPNGWV